MSITVTPDTRVLAGRKIALPGPVSWKFAGTILFFFREQPKRNPRRKFRTQFTSFLRRDVRNVSSTK